MNAPSLPSPQTTPRQKPRPHYPIPHQKKEQKERKRDLNACFVFPFSRRVGCRTKEKRWAQSTVGAKMLTNEVARLFVCAHGSRGLLCAPVLTTSISPSLPTRTLLLGLPRGSLPAREQNNTTHEAKPSPGSTARARTHTRVQPAKDRGHTRSHQQQQQQPEPQPQPQSCRRRTPPPPPPPPPRQQGTHGGC